MHWFEYLRKYHNNVDILTDIDFKLSFSSKEQRDISVLDIMTTDIEEYYVFEKENKFYLQGFLLFQEISSKYIPLTLKELIDKYSLKRKEGETYYITLKDNMTRINFLADIRKVIPILDYFSQEDENGFTITIYGVTQCCSQ